MAILLVLAKTARGPRTGRMAAASKDRGRHFATFSARARVFSIPSATPTAVEMPRIIRRQPRRVSVGTGPGAAVD
jgi:hypothetical protein